MTEKKIQCKYCHNDNRPTCGVADSGFTCTRENGHKGKHVACGLMGHKYHIWSTSKKELK